MADGSAPDNYSLLIGGLAAFFTALAALIMGAVKGRWWPNGQASNPPTSPPEQRYFFDGPVGEHLRLLREQRHISNEVKEHVEPLGEQLRTMNKTLDEIKNHIADLKDIKSRRR